MDRWVDIYMGRKIDPSTIYPNPNPNPNPDPNPITLTLALLTLILTPTLTLTLTLALALTISISGDLWAALFDSFVTFNSSGTAVEMYKAAGHQTCSEFTRRVYGIPRGTWLQGMADARRRRRRRQR